MSSDKTVYVVIGPPGCGKGTRVQLLVEWFMSCFVKILHRITMSDELRLIKKTNRRWYDEYIGRFIDSLRLVPFESVVRVFDPVFRRAMDAGLSIVVDGFPRDVCQAEHLVALAEEYPDYNFVVIIIHVDLGDCRGRMILRGRPGETPEGIDGRLEEWVQFGIPTNKYLSGSKLKVVHVPGGSTPQEGLQNILRATGLLEKRERSRNREAAYSY